MYLYARHSEGVIPTLCTACSTGHPCLFFPFLFTATPTAYGSSRAGVELELQLEPMSQPQQHLIQATSSTFVAAVAMSNP